MEWGRMGWGGVGWSGVGWDGMGWDGEGMGWDRTGWGRMDASLLLAMRVPGLGHGALPFLPGRPAPRFRTPCPSSAGLRPLRVQPGPVPGGDRARALPAGSTSWRRTCSSRASSRTRCRPSWTGCTGLSRS